MMFFARRQQRAVSRNERNHRARHRIGPGSAYRSRGFSLVEALVSIVIISISVLGLAYLQTQGKRFTTSSYARTQATMFAADFMDRARLYGPAAISVAPASNCDLGSTDALSIDPAMEKACWLAQVAETLPSGEGEIDVLANVVTITISWQDQAARERTDGSTTLPIDRSLVWNLEL